MKWPFTRRRAYVLRFSPGVASPSLHRLCDLATRGVDHRTNVILAGAPGVGKTTLARWIHAQSRRNRSPLVMLDCGIDEITIEDAMFGSARTLKKDAYPGAFENAHGGTVVLKNVDALSFGTQAKVLRVLENREVMRCGDNERRTVNVRAVSTTSIDLEGAAHAATFRGDLFHQLSSIAMEVPPLRDRPEEVEHFARHFLAEVAGRNPAPNLSDEVLDLFRSFVWPRNLTQLREVVTKAVARSAGKDITPAHVDVETLAHEGPPEAPDNAKDARGRPDLWTEAQSAERDRIIAALADAQGNATRAARLLGLSRRTFVGKIGFYSVPRPRPQIPDALKEKLALYGMPRSDLRWPPER